MRWWFLKKYWLHVNERSSRKKTCWFNQTFGRGCCKFFCKFEKILRELENIFCPTLFLLFFVRSWSSKQKETDWHTIWALELQLNEYWKSWTDLIYILKIFYSRKAEKDSSSFRQNFPWMWIFSRRFLGKVYCHEKRISQDFPLLHYWQVE